MFRLRSHAESGSGSFVDAVRFYPLLFYSSDGARDSLDQQATRASLSQKPGAIAAWAEDHESQKQNNEQHEPSKPNVDGAGSAEEASETTTPADGGGLTDAEPQLRRGPGKKLDEVAAAAAVAAAVVDAAGTETPSESGGDAATDSSAAATAPADVSQLPDSSRTPPQPPPVTVRASSLQNVAASPSASFQQGARRKRRAGGGNGAPGQRRRRHKGGREPTSVEGERGEGHSHTGDARQNPKATLPRAPPVAGSWGGPGESGGELVGRGGGEGAGGKGQYAAALATDATGAGGRIRAGVGKEEKRFGRSGEAGDDAQSAVVWYRTIVACLMAAAAS